MRLRIFWILIIPTILLLLIVSYLGNNYKKISEPKEENFNNYYDYFVQHIRFEQEKIINEGDSNIVKIRKGFADYFKLFDRLSLEKNWAIDWEYSKKHEAFRPFVWRYKQGENIDSLKIQYNCDYYWHVDSVRILDHIRIEDSYKGYYQLLVFDLIGGYVGDNYFQAFRTDIICSKGMLNQVYSRIKLQPLEPDIKKNIKALDYNVVMRDYKDSVTFRILICNHSDEFRERVYSIKRSIPHKITLVKDSFLFYSIPTFL